MKLKKLKLAVILVAVLATSFAGCKKDEIVTYILNVTATNGTVVKDPVLEAYDSGAKVQLTATPNSGYTFTSWSGDATGSANPLTVTMDANKNIIANFTLNTYTLNVTATNGTVVKNPDLAAYTIGAVVQLTATPNTGYTFTSWSGNASGSTSPLTVTMDGNKNITANFTALPVNINVRSTGATGDGVTDDTGAIQKAIDQVAPGGTVTIPAGTYMINAETSLNLKSNMTLKMESDAILKAIPTNDASYYIIKLSNITMVNIEGGTLWGERESHLGTTVTVVGIGIGIYGSDNVTISNVTVKNCWTNGFYVGFEGKTSANITMDNVTCDNNRSGLYLVSVDGAIIKNSIFKNTTGVGVAIEPIVDGIVNNVKVLNCESMGNSSVGITMNMNNGLITNAVIDGNNVHNNNSTGIVATNYTKGAMISNNSSYANKGNGIAVWTNTEGNTVKNNTVYANTVHGIVIANNSNNNTITGNTVTGNLNRGIILYNSTGTTFTGTTGNVVTGNTATGNPAGNISDLITPAGSNTISDNIVN